MSEGIGRGGKAIGVPREQRDEAVTIEAKKRRCPHASEAPLARHLRKRRVVRWEEEVVGCKFFGRYRLSTVN